MSVYENTVEGFNGHLYDKPLVTSADINQQRQYLAQELKSSSVTSSPQKLFNSDRRNSKNAEVRTSLTTYI